MASRKIVTSNEASSTSTSAHNNINNVNQQTNEFNSIKAASTHNSLEDQARSSKEYCINGNIPNNTSPKVSFSDISKQSNLKNVIIIDETQSASDSAAAAATAAIKTQKIRNEVVTYTRTHKASVAVSCAMNPHQKRNYISHLNLN